jgi:hypothetical protein
LRSVSGAKLSGNFGSVSGAEFQEMLDPYSELNFRKFGSVPGAEFQKVLDPYLEPNFKKFGPVSEVEF